MADLRNVLPGTWPPLKRDPEPPEQQLRSAIKTAGLPVPLNIIADGGLHRFDGNGKKNNKSCWYVFFNDGVPSGAFGCWREGISQTFRADIGRALTEDERQNQERRLAEARAARDVAQKESNDLASNVVAEIWEKGAVASPDHPYLARKKIQPHVARVTGDGRLMIPMYDCNGELKSLQYIEANGEKKYHSGASVAGLFCAIGEIRSKIYIAEGYATGASIYEAMQETVVVAFSASQIPAVCRAIQKQFSESKIIIISDNDQSGIGKNYADQASAETGAKIIHIPIDGDANDYVCAGHDLVALLTEQKSWLVQADEFSQKPAPIKWLIKKWLQSSALIMVHGPSGGGKTFVVLDWCLRIASTVNEWNGHNVTHGTVVYLAGEGHHGLKGRLSAWKQFNRVHSVNLWLSRSGCNLNTREGYSATVSAIREVDKPSLIVVDTLHRFLDGDENSSKDAGTMLRSCAALIEEFGCAVLLVHHTGNHEAAQDRARGSSAWRGALDIEISIQPGGKDKPLKIAQRKVKDGLEQSDIYVDLQSVEIEGWLDDDNEPVTSAVPVLAQSPAGKISSKLESHKKQFMDFWIRSGSECNGSGRPYITKSALQNCLEDCGFSPQTVKNHMMPSRHNGTIGALIVSGVIAPYENMGWEVIDEAWTSAMLMARGN